MRPSLSAAVLLALVATPCLCLALGGCERASEAQLLELSEVGPPLVTPGDALTVQGAGFPTGEQGRVTLQGFTHRPGERPVRTQVTLSGRAAARDLVELTLEDVAFESLQGPGTFAGEIKVAFEGARAGTRVTGVMPIELDLRVPTADALRNRHRRQQQAERLLSFLGVVPDVGVPSHDGVVVDYALSGSRGEAAGLVHGDVIVRSAGVGVHALSDLAPPPGIDSLHLSVMRPGRSLPVTVELPLSGLGTPRLAAHLVPLCLVAAVSLLCLLLVGPWPSLSVWLARCRSRLRNVPGKPWLRAWDDRQVGAARDRSPDHASEHDPDHTPDHTGGHKPGRLGRLRAALWRLVLPASVSLLLFGIAYLQPLLGLQFNSLPIYLGMTAASVVLVMMLAREQSPRRRLRHGAGQLSRMLVVGVAIGSASALGGTPSLDGIVAAQGGLPMGWFVFSQPALFVALPLYLVYASRIVPMEFGGGVHAHALSFVVDVGGRVLVSAIGAAVFLGGWQLSGIPQIDRVDPLVAGAALFTLKAWSISILLHVCRVIGLGDESPGWLGALGALTSLGIAALWIALSVPPGVSLAIGHVLSVTTVVSLLVAWLRVVRSSHPMGSPPSYPLATC